jgi:hypothetical protein
VATKAAKSVGYLAGEAVLIILSITLAFMANGWREEAGNKRNAQEALDYFRLEIKSNLAILERTIPYHEKVVENFRTMTVPEDDPRSALSVLMAENVIPKGVDPPIVSASAWEAALARNAQAYFEFETVYKLSQVYQLQEIGVTSTWRAMASTVFDSKMFDPEQTDAMLPMLRFSFQELLGQEKTLEIQYRKILEHLDK